MTGKLEVLHAGLLTTLQDLGRKGLAYYALPASGSMDPVAANWALRLLGQPAGSALLECTYRAPTLLFHSPVRIALTGADLNWTLNGQPLARKTVHKLRAGDLLSGSKTRKGFRAYLALDGALSVPPVYGSKATYTTAGIGGLDGRPLQKGDQLRWTTTNSGSTVAPAARSDYRRIIPLRPGPEIGYLSAAQRDLLTARPFRIGKDSNRMGARLEGHGIGRLERSLTHSVPVLPGFIQLPPSGLPIVLLQDGQVSGGYPRIAYIPEQWLGSFNQIPLGSSVRFAWE